MEVIAMETAEADKVKTVVSKEEAVASEEAANVQAIKSDCEADLAEAMPVLERALKALNTLTKNDITEVKVLVSRSEVPSHAWVHFSWRQGSLTHCMP
jgi:dynein heavy chain, axonemal